MKKSILSLLIATSALSTGCTMTSGSYGINSHFSFPNSNVTPTKHVQSSMSKLSFIIAPSFTGEEIIQLTQEAIAQQPGANLLINYTLDTKITSFFIATTVELTLEGTAAKMDIGSQELTDFYNKVKYQAQ